MSGEIKMEQMEEGFARAVSKAVSDHLAGLGFMLRRDGSRIFILESAHFRIRVVLEWGTIVTTIKPLSPDPQANYKEIQFDVGWFHTEDDMSDQVDRQIGWIVKRYGDILRGNLEGWPLQST